MAKRLGNISKSSFRFLREASLYAYAGVAILGAVYLSYLAFSYEGEITELQPDFRSELIADSRIDDITQGIENLDTSIGSAPKSEKKETSRTVIPVATKEKKPEKQETSQQNPEQNLEQKSVAQTPKAIPEVSVTPPVEVKTKELKKELKEVPKKPASTSSAKYQWVLKSFNNPEFASNWVTKFSRRSF